MKTKITRLMLSLIIATTIASFLFTSTQATSWIDISPVEVYEQAEFIILGTYDFTGDPSPGNMIFGGYKFEVEKIYRGDVPPTLTVGIDIFDVGWASDYQKRGYKFLLFLEKNEYFAEFPVPIVGPSGMILINDGVVDYYEPEGKQFFQDIYESQGVVLVEQNDLINESMRAYIFILIGILVLFIVILYLLHRRKKRIISK